MIIGIFLVVINLVSAITPSYPVKGLSQNKEIIQLAKELKRETNELTVSETSCWISRNIDYSYSYKSRDILTILIKKEGDCTDTAEIYYQVLGYNGIQVKKVHGYKNGEKHDWILAYYNGKWNSLNEGTRKTGDGFW